MIDNTLVKIIKSDIKNQNRFYKLLKKINKISSKYPTYMGIDFEFNTKKVALMQILFEIHKKEKIIKKYYIIYPPILDQKINDYLKYHIMSNINILKILHGSESLDIPYLVEVFYNMESEPLINFFLSMIDTRYLCEYLNLSKSEPNICRIYDLLFKLKIIDEKEQKLLDLNEDKMGPIYEIFIDINNLSPELIAYSIHDVVYLIDTYIALRNHIIKINSKDYYLLVDCTRYCFMEKRNVTNIGDDLIIINKMNNYFYYVNKSNTNTEIILDKILKATDTKPNLESKDYYYKINMIRTYDIIINDFIESYDSVRFILGINYIKTNILNLFRTIVYVIILKNYKVKASNKEDINYDLDSKFDLIKQGLKAIDLNYLLDLIVKFYEFAEIKLKP